VGDDRCDLQAAVSEASITSSRVVEAERTDELELPRDGGEIGTG
jgi:hypothetical protein